MRLGSAGLMAGVNIAPPPESPTDSHAVCTGATDWLCGALPGPRNSISAIPAPVYQNFIFKLSFFQGGQVEKSSACGCAFREGFHHVGGVHFQVGRSRRIERGIALLNPFAQTQ